MSIRSRRVDRLFYILDMDEKFMPYEEQMKDQRWQIKRMHIFQRDNFKCVLCSRTDMQLHCHHYDYFGGKLAWEYPNDMFATLCHYHHEQEQGRKKIEKALLATLKMKGFLVSDLLALSVKADTDLEFTEDLINTLRLFQNA